MNPSKPRSAATIDACGHLGQRPSASPARWRMVTDTVIHYSVWMDAVARGLAHALPLEGRAASRNTAGVLGVWENPVARRYRKLRGQGLLRVVGTVNGAS